MACVAVPLLAAGCKAEDRGGGLAATNPLRFLAFSSLVPFRGGVRKMAPG